MPRVEINGRVVEFAQMPTPEDIDHVAASLGAAPATTTPTTRTFPQALGQTIDATGTRMIGAGQEYLAQGALPHSLGALGNLATTFMPVVAPEMTLAGMGVETMRRMRPGTTEAEAQQGAEAGQTAGGLFGMGLSAARALPAGLRAFGAARAGQQAEPFAGVAEAGARAVLSKELAKGGGALDETTFAKAVRPGLRAMLRDAERTMQKGTGAQQMATAPQAADLRRLVGRTVSLAPIADAVAKDPVMLATLVRSGGPDMLPELGSAWLTAAMNAATGRAGLRRGVVDVPKLIGLWDDLGAAGQTALYSTRAPALRTLFGQMAEAFPGEGGGAAKATHVGSHLLKTAELLLAGGGVAEAIGGHVARGVGLGLPFVIGKVLVKNGGAEWLSAVGQAMRDPAVFAQAAPGLKRAGLLLLSNQPAPMEPPAPRPMLPFAPPPPAPAAPASPNAMLDSPSGILASIMGTRLPPGWRPGQSPVMP